MGGVRVALERQPAVALTVLVANAGRLVTRAELCRAIWPADTHVDFDRGLNYCLRQIRLALGDDARAPRFIETVPRQGYRFIAPLTGIGPVARRTAGRLRTRAAAAAVITALVTGTYVAESGSRNDDHHRLALRVAQAVHDFLF